MIHCIITIGSDRFEAGMRMLEKINPKFVKVHLVLRGSAFKNFPKISNVHHQIWLESATLSQARNLLLKRMITLSELGNSDVICFADDDGLWIDDFHLAIREAFKNGQKLVLGGYKPLNENQDFSRFPKEHIDHLNLDEILRITSSIGMYVRGDIVKEVGLFNENLGLGAYIPVGEDTEYCLRAFKKSRGASYNPMLMQIHAYGSERKRYESSISLIWYLVSIDKRVFILALRRTMGVFRDSPSINPIKILLAAMKGILEGFK